MWKAHFYLNPNDNGKQKESFAFHSRNTVSKEATKYDWKRKIRESKMVVLTKADGLPIFNWANIKKSSDLIILADKTSNFYRMDPTTYNGLLQKAITKTYKKVSANTTSSIELKAKQIAGRLMI